MLRTKSQGLDTNILELKTWIFGPTGATVVNICGNLKSDFLPILYFRSRKLWSRMRSWKYLQSNLWRELMGRTRRNRSCWNGSKNETSVYPSIVGRPKLDNDQQIIPLSDCLKHHSINCIFSVRSVSDEIKYSTQLSTTPETQSIKIECF